MVNKTNAWVSECEAISKRVEEVLKNADYVQSFDVNISGEAGAFTTIEYTINEAIVRKERINK